MDSSKHENGISGSKSGAHSLIMSDSHKFRAMEMVYHCYMVLCCGQ